MEKIKHVIVSTIISGHASNSSGTRMYAPSVSSCYELFGFDVLLDAKLKPWVMEVNISPSLKASCDMDLGIKSKLSVDLFNLVGIRVRDLAESQKKKKRGPTPKAFLSLSERQKMRHFVGNTDANLLSDLTDTDLRILKESEDENRRKGEFERVFPCSDSSHYFKLFASTPYNDHLLFQWNNLAEKDLTRAYSMLRRLPNASTGSQNLKLISSVQRTINNRPSSTSTPTRSVSTTRSTSAAQAQKVFRNVAQPPIPPPPAKPSPAPPASKLPAYSRSSETAHQKPAAPPEFISFLNNATLIPTAAPQPAVTIPTTNPIPSQVTKQLHHAGSSSNIQVEYPKINPFPTFPDRQPMPMKTSDFSASAAGIVPCLNTEYTLRPSKVGLRLKPGVPPVANLTAQMASLIAHEMQQLQLHQQQFQMMQMQQERYLAQQQAMARREQMQRVNSDASLANEYPSTSAYRAAMAIANVTARFRAMENQGGQGAGAGLAQPGSEFVRREPPSQQELMAWASMAQLQKMGSERESGVFVGLPNPPVVPKRRVSSALRRPAEQNRSK
ncbi:Tubulin polyglutamylase ttll4 [Podochytrium sp. JEL0797]|nr:Tubulin polyglutamylase ttll4 [Podochytrium sp. JEL0797]